MKICKRCFQEFVEDENLYQSPASELADIFSKISGGESVKELCPQCKEELGVKNLIGFSE